MNEIQALIFDMDGVIVDSNPLHVKAWEVYNLKFGLPMDETMQDRMFGKRNDELVRDFFGSHLTEEEVYAHGAAKEAVYREMMRARLAESLVPGIREFLIQYGEMPKGIGTNAERANVEFVLDEANLRRFFSAIVDGEQVTHAKPHPEVYLKVAELLGTAPANCVVFEDSRAGVEAGIAAGMRVVGISTTHTHIAGVQLMAPDFFDAGLQRWLRGNQ